LQQAVENAAKQGVEEAQGVQGDATARAAAYRRHGRLIPRPSGVGERNPIDGKAPRVTERLDLPRHAQPPVDNRAEYVEYRGSDQGGLPRDIRKWAILAPKGVTGRGAADNLARPWELIKTGYEYLLRSMEIAAA
jgi:hypothetical protein